jgi:hypothetical protein
MLARRPTTILPAMTLAEAIETTRIHRVAGLTGGRMIPRVAMADPPLAPAVSAGLPSRRERLHVHLRHPDHLVQASCPREVWPADPPTIHADHSRAHESPSRLCTPRK